MLFIISPVVNTQEYWLVLMHKEDTPASSNVDAVETNFIFSLYTSLSVDVIIYYKPANISCTFNLESIESHAEDVAI